MKRFGAILYFSVAFNGFAMLAATPEAAVRTQGQPAPDFSKDIQPILEQHCLKCHGANKQSGGMRFDQKQVAFLGGDSGEPAITPSHLEQSQMIRRVSSTDKEQWMPPKGDRLSPDEIERLKQWILSGALWPDSPAVIAETKPTSSHWSFQPIQNPLPPNVKDESWPLNPIDRFLQANRESAGLAIAADASPAVFIRRATYDLTGLPPSAEEVQAFEQASKTSSNAYAELVNHLLESPRYGERWGRHWMDWIRYADTAGDNSDFPIPQAYLYRNYLIDSLNEDKPYDRFLTEQLAGDLLPAKDLKERNRLTIATGYLAMARRFGSLVERYPQHLTIEDTIDNLGRTVMGLTLSCARCHDHKFDPISTRDYYGIYGIFASTRYPMPGLELFQTQKDFVPLIPDAEVTSKMRPFQAETDKLTASMEKLLAECEAKALDNARREQGASVNEQRQMTADIDRLLLKARKAGENLAKHLKKLPVIPTAYAVQDSHPVNARIQIKGEPDRPGAEVPRKFIDILGGQPLPPEAQASSGRLQLAQWLTRADNPLTARVMVNRIWQRHFGKGLVPSTSDFGLRGESPTHPELLDWLAHEFIRSGWSIKHMHQLIMTSHAYRLSSQDLEDNVTSDPSNTHYWKFNRQRLDAESIRDTLLLISGSLDLKPQTEPYPIPPSSKWEYTQHYPFKDDYPNNKRSVYQMTKRLTAQPYFQTFDGADANVCTSSRDSSVTALQALYFVNDSFVHEQAGLYAKALLKSAPDDPARLRSAFLNLLAREPTQEENQLLMSHLQGVRQSTGSHTDAWASLARSLFRLNEFLYLD